VLARHRRRLRTVSVRERSTVDRIGTEVLELPARRSVTRRVRGCDVAGESDGNEPPSRIGRILENLMRNQGISVGHLRRWIAGVRQGALSPAAVPHRERRAPRAEQEYG